MAGEDDGSVGQREQLVVDGAEERGAVAAGKVCAADGAGEERVAGQQQVLRREIEADAALGVAGGVEDAAGKGRRSVADGSDGDELAVVERVVGGRTSGVSTPSQSAWTAIILTSGRSFWL